MSQAFETRAVDAGGNGKTPFAIDLRTQFDRLRTASRTSTPPSYSRRIEWLDRLADALRRKQDEIAEAVSRDFGHRSKHETKLCDVLTLLDGIKYTRKHLKEWMRPENRHVSMTYRPATARVHYQPLGVVGIISPWNYPVQLAIAPLVAAIAAGNRVMLKPSEFTPATSELIRRLCLEVFDLDVVTVVTGGPEIGEAFARLPFDHLLYTGSTQVGRLVMKAAAENLTPVTLELGGKSPAIVHGDYPLEAAAARIAAGKWLNSGQTCIAPDYVLAPQGKVAALSDAIAAAVRKSYPTLASNPDYTSIVNDRHYRRVTALTQDAVAKGARKVEINPANETLDPAARKMAPTLLLDVNDGMNVMQEEIFGPVLPILGYDTLEDAIRYVNDHPRPLALYYFDGDEARIQQMLERTVSGGASINETVLHFCIDDLPFGGVGPSGMGAYHGREGFETMSHKKSVLYQAKWNLAGLISPPYGASLERMLKLLMR